MNIHPDLARVVQRLTDEGVQFKLIEGVRSLERQKMLFATGKSKTMNPRHLSPAPAFPGRSHRRVM